jgi:hypothetical protein
MPRIYQGSEDYRWGYRHTDEMATGSEILYELELSWNKVQSGFQGIMATGLEEMHRTLRGSLLEAQARQTKYASGKETFKVRDMDH